MDVLTRSKLDARFWMTASLLSASIHLGLGVGLSVLGRKTNNAFRGVSRVRVQAPPAAEAPKPAEIKPEPKKPKPKEPKKLHPVETPKIAPPNVAPVQGISKDNLTPGGTISAPVGNTMMAEDTGKRLSPDDVKPMQGDMSAAARLISSSVVTPTYTELAIDAGLEGSWTVDVYVDKAGTVTSAELRKKIGYGMDERVLSAARNAKFQPRKNKFGATEDGWAEIKFTLVIP